MQIAQFGSIGADHAIQRYPTILNQMIDIEYLRLRWPGSGRWVRFLQRPQPPARESRVYIGAFMLMRRKVFESGRFI